MPLEIKNLPRRNNNNSKDIRVIKKAGEFNLSGFFLSDIRICP